MLYEVITLHVFLKNGYKKMKRITYISEAPRESDADTLENISTVSQRNNQQFSITGVLIFLKGFFFQVIEGEETTLRNNFV